MPQEDAPPLQRRPSRLLLGAVVGLALLLMGAVVGLGVALGRQVGRLCAPALLWGGPTDQAHLPPQSCMGRAEAQLGAGHLQPTCTPAPGIW